MQLSNWKIQWDSARLPKAPMRKASITFAVFVVFVVQLGRSLMMLCIT